MQVRECSEWILDFDSAADCPENCGKGGSVAISGYADVLSTQPGGTLNLYVSTDAPNFRVEFYRLGATLAGPLMGMPVPDIRAGQDLPARGCTDDWGWPAYPFTIPQDWQTGVYIAMFVEVDGNGVDSPNQPLNRGTADADDRKAMFVVRQSPDAAGSILFKVPTATYAAYNWTGGASTYTGQVIASLRRPGCGTGGTTTFSQSLGTQVDVYDPSSDRMKVVHLEAPFIQWLENNGYSVDYCTDFDLHFDPTLLDPYQLLLSVGHDEYWSEEMRSAVGALLQRGGNVAFFSGNTCWKYITFPADWQLRNNGSWRDNNKTPENQFTGVSYYYGNGRWDGWRQVVGYALQITDHWILSGVAGGTLGDVYADNGDPAGLIGYECDGAPSTPQNGIRVPTGAPTPAGFLILGQAQLDGSWQDNGHGVNVCTMGLYSNSGVAFTVGTVDWGRVLASLREPRVERITRNVLDTLSVRLSEGWASRGGQLTSVPAVAANADGRLEAFGRGYDGGLYHVWQTAPNGGWSNWASEGGAVAGDGDTPTRLAVARNADGRLSVFACFDDDSVRYITQIAPNNAWGKWTTLNGNVQGDPAVGVNADGRLEVFVVGFDGHLYHAWQLAPGGEFSNWANEGGALVGDLAVASNADGRLEVFARGFDDALWHIWQTAPNSGWWEWYSLGGGLKSDPALGVNADGRLEVFARGSNDAVWHIWQTAPNNGWSEWDSLGGALTGEPAVGVNADGRLEVFVPGIDDALWHIWQTAPNNGWSDWDSLGGALAGDPAVGVNADGRLEVFVVSVSHTLWHRWQNSPGIWY